MSGAHPDHAYSALTLALLLSTGMAVGMFHFGGWLNE